MENYIVLDIDRTIIKGTSWYYTCKCGDLLIKKDKIPIFEKINEKLFTKGNEKTREQFRIETFNLMEKQISSESLQLLNSAGIKNTFTVGENISNEFIKTVGRYTLRKLVDIDENCVKFLSWIYHLFLGDVTFLFLTSGYTPYMNGLIEEYIKLFEEKIEWQVIGTELEIDYGIVHIKEVNTQTRKYNIVKEMISANKKIVFLADDSLADPRLFNIVNANGGYTFNVRYDQHEKKLNWDELLHKVMDKGYLYEYLVNRSSIRIDKQKNIINQCKLKERYNQIGILCYNSKEFADIYVDINDSKITEEIEKFVFRKENNVYLRGELYYFWLPKYINLSYERKIDGWKNLYFSAIKLFKLIKNSKNRNEAYDYLISYIACDHLLAALYLLLYCIEEELKIKCPIDVEDYSKIKEAIYNANNVLYDIICEHNFSYYYAKLEVLLDSIKLSDSYLIEKNEKFMLELDNYSTIFSFATNILKEIGSELNAIDGVVALAYGATALGYAIKVVIDRYRSEPIKIFLSHFSYRKHSNIEEYVENNAEYDEMQEIKDEVSILVVDNNVTTFETLSSIKKYLESKGKKVLCAVPEIDYDNICRWLYNERNAESLCKGWWKTLDFLPIKSYVSAYDTWGTSEKSHLLEELFIKKAIPFAAEKKYSKVNYCEHRKICRVHNVYDLQVAIDMGATMIGIHAVVSNKNNYYNQTEAVNVENLYPNLPVCDYEIDAINHMIRTLPDNITPILLLEKQQTIEDIEKIVDIYGMNISNSGIQLQFEVDKSFVTRLINMGFVSVIVSIGVTQSDKCEYLNNILNILRKDKDFILVDMSKHQPQLISDGVCNENAILSFGEKYDKLDEIVELLQGKDYQVLLADDICPSEFLMCQLKLASNNVNVVGLDMQNIIEEKRENQRFCSIYDGEKEYYAKVRKSLDKVNEWMKYEIKD